MKKKSDLLFAFFGTPRFSVYVLDALKRHGFLPALVITAPDRPQGRGLRMRPSPAKAWALDHDIDVMTPATLKDEPLITELHNSEWDVFVVAAYAKLIPKRVLEIPKYGCLNVHPSLLPKFRGPSPALSAILVDERSTGVSLMLMNEKMDEGPLIAQARIELEEAAWPPKGSEFEVLLATEGGNLLSEVLPQWVAGDLTPEPQNEERATYTKKFVDEDACIDPSGDPHAQFLKIRAFDRNPRAHFFTPEGTRVIVTDAEVTDGTLNILKVIPEGKNEMAYSEFVRGRK